jgi:hypothetical protein
MELTDSVGVLVTKFDASFVDTPIKISVLIKIMQIIENKSNNSKCHVHGTF